MQVQYAKGTLALTITSLEMSLKCMAANYVNKLNVFQTIIVTTPVIPG